MVKFGIIDLMIIIVSLVFILYTASQLKEQVLPELFGVVLTVYAIQKIQIFDESKKEEKRREGLEKQFFHRISKELNSILDDFASILKMNEPITLENGLSADEEEKRYREALFKNLEEISKLSDEEIKNRIDQVFLFGLDKLFGTRRKNILKILTIYSNYLEPNKIEILDRLEEKFYSLDLHFRILGKFSSEDVKAIDEALTEIDKKAIISLIPESIRILNELKDANILRC